MIDSAVEYNPKTGFKLLQPIIETEVASIKLLYDACARWMAGRLEKR